MRVLHVDTERGWRGGQVQLELLLRGLAARGVEQALWAPVGAPLTERWAAAQWSPAGRWWGRRSLAAGIRAFAPDVVAVHTAHGLALAPAWAPVVVHRRNDFVPSWWASRRYRRVLGVIAVSAAVADLARRAGAQRVEVVRDGVPAPLRRWSPPAEPRLLAVGALVAHKGHRHAIEAMVDVPASLDIAGEGPLRGALTAQIRRLGLEDRVRLLGQVGDVGERLARCAALVHPSVEEGLGQVLLEATAAGTPIVASAVGGIPEVVTRTLVPPADPAALARALRRALTRPTPSDGGRGVDAMVDETLAAYRSLLR